MVSERPRACGVLSGRARLPTGQPESAVVSDLCSKEHLGLKPALATDRRTDTGGRGEAAPKREGTSPNTDTERTEQKTHPVST